MKIVWADPAQFDLENIRDYIFKDSEFYASNFVDEIFEAVEHLQEFPEMGRNVPEADDPNMRDIARDKIKPWDIA